MKKHGFRSIFSLLLALMMVCSMLPTAAFAEGDVEEQSVVVEPVGTPAEEPKQDEVKQPEGETPEEPKQPEGETPEEPKQPEGETPEEPKQPEGETSQGPAKPADAAPSDAGVPGRSVLTVPPMPDPGVTLTALDTGHKIDVRFTVLYVGDEFNLGYNYGSSEKTKFVCQYSQPHGDTAYSNHTIAISDIKAAADRASVNSGYQIVGWSKEANANPTTWGFNLREPTACNKGTTIYLVAKNPNPTTKYTYTLNYDANGGTGAPSADSWSTTDASTSYHSFTVTSTVPTRAGYTFKGWKGKANDRSDEIYTGGMTCAVSQYGNDVVKNGNTWTRTLYAVWEENKPTAPTKPTEDDIIKGKILGDVTIECTNTSVQHGSKSYPLTKESITSITEPVYDSNAGQYSCMVTVSSTGYVHQFDTEKGVTHMPDDKTRSMQLLYYADAWHGPSGDPSVSSILFKVACTEKPEPPKAPDAPSHDELSELIGDITVNCTNDKATHEPKSKGYALISDSYTPSEVKGDADNGYTYTVTINSQKYVYAFDGETNAAHDPKDATATVTLRWSGAAWTVERGAPVTFNVACKTEEPEVPGDITDEDLKKLSVVINCTNEAAAHEDKSKSYALDKATYELNYTEEGYACEITVPAAPYVNKYTSDTTTNHELVDPQESSKTFTLRWNTETKEWAADSNSVTFDVKCKPDAPKAEDLLSVVIHCKSDVHNDGLYDLKDGNFTVGEVEGNEADGYTCKVTVEAAQYVNKYVGEMKVNHDIVGEDTKTVTLKYESAFERWTVDSTVVTFDVECIPAPNISMLQVQVHCVTPNSSHMDEFYDLPEDTTLEYVDANTRKITVQAAPYVEQYGNGHELADGESESKTITITWDGTKWVFDATSVTFYVKCETQPEVPGDITDEDLAKLKVVIHCTTNGSHTDGTYDLIPEIYRPDYSDGGFTCYIAVLAAPYVNEYISDTGTNHELVDPQKSSKTITLRWNTETKAWAADSNSVTFDVKCTTQEGPAQKYTVTYTDGVDGVEIFKDQVYADLTAGTATPKFNGTPTRVGYFFAGWNPAVADTVTGNATYTASWKVDSNNNGKPDDEEERYTVTYLDGANGKAFASQVYPGLLSGTATPKFNGTPVRSGYVFIGWSPVWSGTVTGNVTYTATWSTITGGLDKVPKTGDNGLTLALSALLLFSFCGAAACVVSTKKRG